MPGSTAPNPDYHPPDWFIADEKFKLELLPAGCLEFFKSYTALSDDQVLPHILRIRREAWDFCAYPCIGILYFLDPQLCKDAAYPDILEAIKSGAKLLDLGCCLGQDMRKLIADGAPSRNLFGADLFPEFIELGYMLFLDREKLAAEQFIAPVNVLDQGSDAPLFQRLGGQMDYIHLGNLLHLFTWDQQVIIATLVSKLLKNKPGAMAVGQQTGSETPGEYGHWVSEKTIFKHNEVSFRKLWSEVPGKWKVGFAFMEVSGGLESQLHKSLLENPHSRLFRFTVERR